MSEIDKIKEEIGWLKIVFGLLIVTDISLIGWIARNIFIHSLILFAAIFIVALITWIIMVINQRVYKALDDLGDL